MIDKFKDFDDAFIGNVVGFAGDIRDEAGSREMTPQEMQKFTQNFSGVIGGQLVSQLDAEAFDFDVIKRESIDNPLLFDSFVESSKELAALETKVMNGGELSQEEISKFLAADMKMQTIADEFVHEDFKFDDTSRENFEQFEDRSIEQFAVAYQDFGTPEFDPNFDIRNSMQAMDSAAGFIDFSKEDIDFEEDFVKNAQNIKDLADNAKREDKEFNFVEFNQDMEQRIGDNGDFNGAFAAVDYTEFYHDGISIEDIQGNFIPGQFPPPPLDNDGNVLPPLNHDGAVISPPPTGPDGEVPVINPEHPIFIDDSNEEVLPHEDDLTPVQLPYEEIFIDDNFNDVNEQHNLDENNHLEVQDDQEELIDTVIAVQETSISDISPPPSGPDGSRPVL